MAGFAPELPRTLAGRFQLVRLLARGGMAEVWEGRDDVLSRPVAVKILLPHLAADPQLRERFRREAVTAARLVHPGIVAIFDAGVDSWEDFRETAPGSSPRVSWRDEDVAAASWPDGHSVAFIIMELVPGETLRDLLRRTGPLEPRLAVGIASQVTDALAYAHAQGLVHRDIKPANVLLRDEGAGLAQVKVADFGIAKAAAFAGDLTAQGALLGTPKYVAPEQVEGREPDARADLYSLGVVLFEMLAGQAPFQCGTDVATALAHVQKPPPPLTDFRPDLPPQLVDLVSALLVKQPEHRVPSARALASSLSEIGRDFGFPAGGPGTFLFLGGAARFEPGAAGPAVAESFAGPTQYEAAGAGQTAGSPVSGGGGARTASVPPTDSLAEVSATVDGEVPVHGRPKGRRRRAPRAKRSHRLASVVVAALLIAGASVVAALLYSAPHPGRSAAGRRGTTASSSTPSTSAHGPVEVLAIREVTVGGNLPNDNVGELPNLISDNAGTYWQSDKYEGPRFGEYGGFGLALELKGTRVVNNLQVTTPMQDWSAEAFVAQSFSSSLGAWGRATSSQNAIYGDHTFSLGGKRASWVLLWMLNPGPTDQATIEKLRVS